MFENIKILDIVQLQIRCHHNFEFHKLDNDRKDDICTDYVVLMNKNKLNRSERHPNAVCV